MNYPATPRTIRAILYGGGSALLIIDTILLARAVFMANFVPIVPVLAGILTAAGLLLILAAEARARVEDARDHRRIARVANQLTSPISSLKADLSSILENADKLPAEVRLKIKHMDTKSAVLLDNVRDVFLALQAGEGPISGEVRVYDLCTLVEEAHQRTAALASAHNVEVVSKAHCRTAPVKVDKRLLLIALTHVIDNAILYTMTPGMVNIAIVKGKQAVRVIVQDRGIGIKSQDIPIIFRPFARGHQAAKHDPDGIGLGLALSRLILREWGGTIQYTNRKNALGSEFSIRLPLYQKK